MSLFFSQPDHDAQQAVDARLRRVAHRVSNAELSPGLHERMMRAVRESDAPALLRYTRVKLAWAAAFVTILLISGGSWLIGRMGQQKPAGERATTQAAQPVQLPTRQGAAWEAQAPRIASLPAEHMTMAMSNEVSLLAQDISGAAAFLRNCMAAQ